jgi:hypothetical protein
MTELELLALLRDHAAFLRDLAVYSSFFFAFVAGYRQGRAGM